MNCKTAASLFLVLLVLPLAACTKLRSDVDPFAGLKPELAFHHADFLDAIPADYGELVGVTVSPLRPAVAHLWFQRSDRSIVVMQLHYTDGILGRPVLTIPRR